MRGPPWVAVGGGRREGRLAAEEAGRNKYPKMTMKLSYLIKRKVSARAKILISTRERKFLGQGILTVFIVFLSV